MIWKTIKLGVLSTAAAAVVGGIVFGSDLGSYVKSSARCVSTAMKDNVPVEFELRRARDLLDEILPEMQANIRAIAEQEVELTDLKAEIADGDKALAEQKGKVAKVRDCLSTSGNSFSIGRIIYTRDELKGDLARRFERTKEAEMSLSGKRRLLSNRERTLAASMQALERTQGQRAQLESQIAALETQNKLIQMASVDTPGVHFDRSKLAQTEKLIADIKKQLDVSERVLAHEAKFVDSIPMEQPVNEKELLTEVDAYLSPSSTTTAEKTDEPGTEVSRADHR
jgi:septal ring factor EnvC (AmiA/AmiB activator)